MEYIELLVAQYFEANVLSQARDMTNLCTGTRNISKTDCFCGLTVCCGLLIMALTISVDRLADYLIFSAFYIRKNKVHQLSQTCAQELETSARQTASAV